MTTTMGESVGLTVVATGAMRTYNVLFVTTYVCLILYPSPFSNTSTSSKLVRSQAHWSVTRPIRATASISSIVDASTPPRPQHRTSLTPRLPFSQPLRIPYSPITTRGASPRTVHSRSSGARRTTIRRHRSAAGGAHPPPQAINKEDEEEDSPG